MTKNMGRPCKPDTRYFKRELTPAQRAIIRAAGAGDLSCGFQELLAVYAHLHAQGFRHGMRPDSIRFVSNSGDDGPASPPAPTLC
jgi:hypothetical protein